MSFFITIVRIARVIVYKTPRPPLQIIHTCVEYIVEAIKSGDSNRFIQLIDRQKQRQQQPQYQ